LVSEDGLGSIALVPGGTPKTCKNGLKREPSKRPHIVSDCGFRPQKIIRRAVEIYTWGWHGVDVPTI